MAVVPNLSNRCNDDICLLDTPLNTSSVPLTVPPVTGLLICIGADEITTGSTDEKLLFSLLIFDNKTK